MPSVFLREEELGDDGFCLAKVGYHKVVFAFDKVKVGLAVDGVVALAAPEGYDAVAGAMDDAYRPLVVA